MDRISVWVAMSWARMGCAKHLAGKPLRLHAREDSNLLHQLQEAIARLRVRVIEHDVMLLPHMDGVPGNLRKRRKCQKPQLAHIQSNMDH